MASRSEFFFLLKSIYLSLSLIGASELPLKIEKFNTSPALPTVGCRIKFRVTLRNEGNEILKNVNLSLSLINKKDKKNLSKLNIDAIHPNEAMKIELGEWIAAKNGIYEIELKIEANKTVKVFKFTFPVVERKVEFAWYGTPRDLRWATISTTIEPDYIDQWLWEGRTPFVFKPGVCFWDRHKDSPIEEQVACWSQIPFGAEGIGIDEFGPGETGDKVKEAIKKFKEKNPSLKIALWNIGGIPQDLASYVDYLIPECYLNYHNMHIGFLLNFINDIKSKNMQRKTLLGLGINYEPGQGTLLTTDDELETQFRTIKTLCPDLLGVAIFYYGSVSRLDRKADELFYRYFILPLLVCDWEIKEEKGKPIIHGWVKNIGNMDGGPIELLLLIDGKETKKTTYKEIKVNESKKFVLPLENLENGFHNIKLKIISGVECNIVDNRKNGVFIFCGSSSQRQKFIALFLPPCPYLRKYQPLRFPLPKGWVSGEVYLVNSKGKTLKKFTTQVNEENELVWVEEEIPANENRFYFVYPAKEKGFLSFISEEKIEMVNEFYKAEVNISKDEITSVKVEGEELFSSPWRMELHPSFNLQPSVEEAKIKDGRVFKEVLVPFKGEGFRGISSYIFYYKSPLIEIRRRLDPEVSLKLDSAREGAGFYQKEGFYVAFPGEGAQRISKGKLENTDQYKDIYFGYLGNSPEPENSDKAGWFDFCWDGPDIGLGIGIVRRWIDSKSRTYDVTRFYDAGDWVDVFYVFQTSTLISRSQRSFLIILPHKSIDLEKDTVPIKQYYDAEKTPLKPVPLF